MILFNLFVGQAVLILYTFVIPVWTEMQHTF